MTEESRNSTYAAAFEFVIHYFIRKKAAPSKRATVNWIVIEHEDPEGVRKYYTQDIHDEIVSKISKIFEASPEGSTELRSDTPGGDHASDRQEA